MTNLRGAGLQGEFNAAPTGMPDSRLSRLLDRAVAATLDFVEMVQAKRAVRYLTTQRFVDHVPASYTDCGHHQHFTHQIARKGTHHDRW